MEQYMDINMRLRRFCFLGSLDPIYTHMRLPVDVDKYWPILALMLKCVDDKTLIAVLQEFLHRTTMVRLDETIFVYAAYFASSVSIEWKTSLRHVFPELIRTDEELFMFCKYTTLISKIRNKKGFSHTVRKAIIAWYETQTPESISQLWMARRGLHGFTHKGLIKMCHINDEKLGSPNAAKPFFRTCAELVRRANEIGKKTTAEKQETQPEAEPSTTSTAAPAAADIESSATDSKLPKKPPASSEELIVGVAKLRTITKNHDALKIIRKYKLSFNYIPGQFLTYAPIMNQIIPSMTPCQILKCWRKMARNKHFENQRLFKICKSRLENKELIKRVNLHPIHVLMLIRKIGIPRDRSSVNVRRAGYFKMDYLEEFYMNSFQWHTGSGQLRMHITLNLLEYYKKKPLKNHRGLSYYEACVALALGYTKREQLVDVFYWNEHNSMLKKILATKEKSTDECFRIYNSIHNEKNYQRLVTPVMNALTSSQIYDVFLCIVPTAGRRNPSMNSDLLCRFMDKYREKKNPNAKFIILNLLKFKRSMTYSKTRNENILEICGLDEHTPHIIHNFATHRFE